MNLTLHNYEAWFLDYLEGNLSESQLAKFYAFLEQHPELKEELDIDLEEVTLQAESVEFIPKTDLHKELELGTITHKNIDFFLIAELEGELTQKQEKELTTFLAANKQYQKDQALYAKTKLSANETIVYPFKRELKKSTVFIRSLYV
ncbi:MAG: hypothetical protein KDC92_14530, partial [Bacteroidetes bacterium]|nr:hypothetical protein [Bacteroidota bacterium]